MGNRSDGSLQHVAADCAHGEHNFMGAIQPPQPVLRLVAIVSRHDDALGWARARIEETWGEHAMVSDALVFDDTDYYNAEMGTGLRKQFVVSAKLMDPGELADVKRQTNTWEAEYAAQAEHAEPRPLNLDPGYIAESKLVLASTKNHSHRIYLSRGIYAEITLGYSRSEGWISMPWTYPDYQRADFQQFFAKCRQHLRTVLRQRPPGDELVVD